MKRSIYIIIYLLLTIAIGAIGDGMAIDHATKLTHLFKAFEILLLISCGFVFKLTIRNLIALLVVYISLRIACFDPIHNIVAGLDILYVGTTSLWDKLISNWVPTGIVFARVIFLLLGIGVAFKELNNEHKFKTD